MQDVTINCNICKRVTPIKFAEEHHLISHCKKGKETRPVCRNCGDMLHKLFSIHELTKQYNTLDKILANEDVQNWISWIQKKPNDFNICMKTKKRRY